MGITGKQRGRHIFADGISTGQRTYAADGPIAAVDGVHLLTKATAGAHTLPVPGRDGIRMAIVNRTAAAHVVTATGLLDDGTGAASKNAGTFAAFPGAVLELISGGNKWNVVSKQGVVIA